MPLKLMYITNCPDVARIAESAGVDRIFVDLEYIGKADRQGGMDTVQSHHTLEDIRRIADSVKTAEVLVRVNPIHNAFGKYSSSEEEIDAAIENGAKILMLPFFKTVQEIKSFLHCVNGRAETMLLLETPEAVNIIDGILDIGEIGSVHIGLNDLSLGYGVKFMFELLADGTVDRLCAKFREAEIPYGFGGIASLGKGMIPAELIIKGHYRLGSTCAILSRSFCNVSRLKETDDLRAIFTGGIHEIRKFEKTCVSLSESELNANHRELAIFVNRICEGMK